jgi:hypothetical protein
MKVSLNFKFKGSRNYVHGTDMFSQVIEFIKNKYGLNGDVDIDMSIHSIVRNCMDLYEDTDLIGQKADVIFNLTYKGLRKSFALIENEHPVQEKYEYPEDEIIDAATTDKENKIISIDNPAKYSFIENVVALNKGLLNHLYGSTKGKWYFTRIKLRNFNFLESERLLSLRIEFKKNLQFKITDSLIYLNGKNVGNIYFSLV